MSSKALKERLQQLAPLSQEEKDLDSYEHIDLTDEEKDAALRLAREAKHYHQQRVRYQEELNRPRPLANYTAEEYYKAFTNIFPIDEEQEKEYSKIVKVLCAYFSNDPRFKTVQSKLDKGILLFGGVGVGKTTLLQAFRQNMAFSYRIISCRDIEAEFSEGGEAVIRKYSFNFKVPVNSNPYGHQEIGYCFDDLGTETSVSKHYGKAKNVMSEILLNRYDNGLDGRATHITTNLSEKEIEEVYGTRVIDRIRGSYNIIAFPENAKSRR
jgi:DNA replication protein DnaC